MTAHHLTSLDYRVNDNDFILFQDRTDAEAAPLPSLVPSAKSSHLDGLRGLAALIVAIWHGFQSYFWAHRIWDNRYTPSIFPLTFILNGPHMVSIFFALSGRVLVERLYKSPPQDLGKVLAKAILRRQIRLLLPIYATCALLWLFTRSGIPSFAHALFSNHVSTHVLDGGYGAAWHDMRIVAATPFPSTYAIFGHFFLQTENNIWNYAVFWTLPFELVGSDIIYILTLICLCHEIFGLVLLFSVFMVINSWGNFLYSPFVGGLLLCHLKHGLPSYSYLSSRPAFRLCKTVVLVFCFGISLIFWSCTNEYYGPTGELPIHSRLASYGDIRRSGSIAAVATIYWIDETTLGHAIFTIRPLQFLGKTSFGLYLIHGGCMTTVASSVIAFLLMYTSLSYGASVCIGVAIGIAVAIPLGYWFVIYIDSYILTVSQKFTNMCLGERKSCQGEIDALLEGVSALGQHLIQVARNLVSRTSDPFTRRYH